MADVEAIVRRFRRLKSRRDGYWQGLWRQVRHYCMPDQEDTLPKGAEAGLSLFDTTALAARERLASGMYSWMAPSDRRWFKVQAADRGLSETGEVADWFALATDCLEAELASSNWAGELLKSLNDLACGLDAVLYCEDGGAASSLAFRSYPVETVCYAVDERDRVDTVLREFELTARQMLMRFGDDCPAEVRELAESQDRCDEARQVLHAVTPREVVSPEEPGPAHMPFLSLYIDLKTRSVLSEGGYEEMPYAVCRFRKSNREQYGRGPGIDALPEIRMLNAMRECFLRNAEQAADPPWMIPDGSLASRNFNKGPGGLIFYRPALSGARPEPVPRGNALQLDAQVIEGERQRVRERFFWDVFDPLGDLRNMTAQEAVIRNNAKMTPFAPIAGNMHADLFGPMIQRAFGVCLRRGLLPPPPAALLEDPAYKVEFVSKIALSLKRQSAQGWISTEASIQGLATIDPAVMDNFDRDRIARDMAEANGCEAEWLVPAEERDRLRAERQEAQAQSAQTQLAADMAGKAGQLSRAPEPGSPLGMMMSGVREAMP